MAPIFHFRPKASIFHPFNLIHLKHTLHLFLPSHRLSPFCSLNGVAETSKESTLPCGVGKAVNEASRPKILQVVLVSPQIPGNTGGIARTCAASAVGLHLVGPLGFKVDNNKLKRAGLDYWPYVVVKVHDSWAEFCEYFRQQEGQKRLLAFTRKGTKVHSDRKFLWNKWETRSVGLFETLLLNSSVPSTARPLLPLAVGGKKGPLKYQREREVKFVKYERDRLFKEFSYRKGDYLLFGSETSGLPPEVLLDCNTEPFGGGTIRIPIIETYVRCLNLSVSVGVALYEASRQLNYEQIQIPSVRSIDTEQSFITEDIFG
ncbi:putative tRNA (cytidine(34)-2'-O)-methyltransferase [Senna tora]|uniref:Putative tRNA (Cytidine(34)-2'-O)-methyltransferase n=1 Tax=Senna tora TaxID=362788 RepID=A0A835CEI5_9FABA|nr:putative tRNA (cytidine(34)-2'-O)-methyltransferase [Senna tora]